MEQKQTVEEAATTLDQFNKKYTIGSMDNYNRVTQQWKNAGWEIQAVYNLLAAEEISASKARELTRYIIDAAAASLPTNSMQWVRASERMINLYPINNSHEFHYKLDGYKVDGFFLYSHCFEYFNPEIAGYTQLDFSEFNRIEWLDEPAPPHSSETTTTVNK